MLPPGSPDTGFLQSRMDQLEREMLKNKLGRDLKHRPAPEELAGRRILHGREGFRVRCISTASHVFCILTWHSMTVSLVYGRRLS